MPGQESAGESFYMLFRAIKHQVDKGPVDAVTGKAKYTLNDNRLLREDVEYRTLVRAHVDTLGYNVKHMRQTPQRQSGFFVLQLYCFPPCRP